MILELMEGKAMRLQRGTSRPVALFVAVLALLFGNGGNCGATAAMSGDTYTAQLVGAMEVPPAPHQRLARPLFRSVQMASRSPILSLYATSPT